MAFIFVHAGHPRVNLGLFSALPSPLPSWLRPILCARPRSAY